MIRYRIFFGVLLCVVVGCSMPLFSHAAVSCTDTYTSTSKAIPAGFGAAYNLFSTTHEQLLIGTCNDTSVLIRYGSGASNQYIYQEAMYWNGSAWAKVQLAGTQKAGVWYVGQAYATLPLSGNETQIIAYICQNIGGAWKCGCRDGTCAQVLWNMQSISHPQTSTSNTGSQTTGSASKPWLMGYYVDFQAGSFSTSEIDYNHLTHIAVGRVLPNTDGTLTIKNEQITKDIAHKAHREGVKVLLWIGGGGTDQEWIAATNDETRKTFARNIISLMDEYDYDGVDLNWEPIRSEDRNNVLALVKELRKRDADMLITLPVDWVRSNKDYGSELTFLSDISDYVDRIFIMTYSMTGPWSGWQSWHNSPLYGDTSKTPNSIDSSITAYNKAGIPMKKLGFGVGLYGRCFIPPITAPRMDIPATYTWSVTSLPYATIREVSRDSDADAAWDSIAKVPYLYRATSTKSSTYCSYITYDDERSILEKAKYLNQKGLGGLMLWTLGSGYLPDASVDERQPLLRAAYQGVIEKKW